MTESQGIILTALLSLGEKIAANNPDVDADISAINTAMSQDATIEYGAVADTLFAITDKTTQANRVLGIRVINSLNCLAAVKDAMIGRLLARDVKMDDKVALANFIDSALSSSIKDFTYYQTVVRFAVALGDPARTAAVIQKIESL